MSRVTSGSGFTLIEMMVVLAIIGTLAMLVGPSILRNVGDANVTAARTQIETFAVARHPARTIRIRTTSTRSAATACPVVTARARTSRPGVRQ